MSRSLSKTKSILVTGGAGYIGSHTAKALKKQGYQPVILDNLSAGHRWAVRWGPLVEGDIGDADLVRRTIEHYGIRAVIHFAANAYVGESMVYPRKYFNNNVVKTLSLLDAMMDCGVDRVVFSSTCATYGIPETLPILEDHGQSPVNPYGESKLFVEKTLRWYGEAHGLRSVCLRYFNAAGADSDGEIGECHTPETHLIPLAIEAALGIRPNIQIFGTDYPGRDGTAIRDYIHVGDLAKAHVQSLDYLFDGGQSTSLNLGTGIGHSVLEVVRSVERTSKRCIPVWERPRRAGDPAVLIASAKKASSVINWKARFTDLDDIVRSAWTWHSRNSRAVAAAV